MTPSDYLRLKAERETLTREEAKAQGRLESVLKRLKEEHGCKELKEAKSLLDGKQMELEKGRVELDKMETEFRKRWEEKL